MVAISSIWSELRNIEDLQYTLNFYPLIFWPFYLKFSTARDSMESSIITAQKCFVQKSKEEEESIERIYAKNMEIISTLPKEKGWFNIPSFTLRKYQGFWHPEGIGLAGILFMQQHFKARPDDIFLATFPKCGTTWFKALIFSIVNRTRFTTSNHPLLAYSPHECVPFMELNLFSKPPIGDVELLPSPRLLATHVPHTSLPESILKSGGKVVYVCRNAKDVFVSLWHFAVKLFGIEPPGAAEVEEAFESFCNGVSRYGPYWDHVLGYWKSSLESPNNILFIKYEEMSEKPLEGAKKLASFLDRPFSVQEEESGVVNQIIKLCNFDNMRNLEPNKTGNTGGLNTNLFFREGKIGGWKNHLTLEMVERLDKITQEKFAGTGLSSE